MSYSKTIEQARFDVRLPKKQKEVIELAATLSGFKSFSEFVVHTTFTTAKIIIEKHHSVLASEKDRKIFFDAIVHPPKPNKNLIVAARKYQKSVSSK